MPVPAISKAVVKINREREAVNNVLIIVDGGAWVRNGKRHLSRAQLWLLCCQEYNILCKGFRIGLAAELYTLKED